MHCFEAKKRAGQCFPRERGRAARALQARTKTWCQEMDYTELCRDLITTTIFEVKLSTSTV